MASTGTKPDTESGWSTGGMEMSSTKIGKSGERPESLGLGMKFKKKHVISDLKCQWIIRVDMSKKLTCL